MRKASLMVAACVTLFWAGAALATATPQQKCNKARQDAWKIYRSCLDKVVAKQVYGTSFDRDAAFAKCRHKYFHKWATWQKTAYIGSICVGSRFTSTDSGMTVTDNLSGLVWEKKDDAGGVHDRDNVYTWSAGSDKGDGSAFEVFLTGVPTGLNVVGFAGARGWRLPTLAELQTIVLDFTCTGAGGGPTCSCASTPCVDPALDAANTQSAPYWSATSYAPNPHYAWFVSFTSGDVYHAGSKTHLTAVRAVRGGL